MTKRFKAHIFDDGLHEKYYDGIIDFEDDKVIKNYHSISNLLNDFVKENEQLKQIIEDFSKNPTQHNLWKLRTTLKDFNNTENDGDVE